MHATRSPGETSVTTLPHSKISPVQLYPRGVGVSSRPTASCHVLTNPSFLAFSQTLRTKSGRAAPLPARDFFPNSIVERSVPMLIKEKLLLTRARLESHSGTGTSRSFTSPVL